VGLTKAVHPEIPLVAATAPIWQLMRRLGAGERSEPTSSRLSRPRPNKANTQCMELASRSGRKERRELAVLIGLPQAK